MAYKNRWEYTREENAESDRKQYSLWVWKLRHYREIGDEKKAEYAEKKIEYWKKQV